MYGDNFSFTDTSLLEFGIANRKIESFRKAAIEAGMSRLYGGIHYRFDLDEGNKMGMALGDLVVQRLRMRKDTHTDATSLVLCGYSCTFGKQNANT